MKDKRFLLLIFFQLLFSYTHLFAQNAKIVVKVLDKNGNPIPGVLVSIDKSKFYTSSDNGSFEFIHSGKLVMPFKVIAEKSDFKINEFIYLEEEKVIEITMSAIEKKTDKETIITLISTDKSKTENLSLTINGETYISDKTGKVTFKGDAPDKSIILIDGYQIVKENLNGNNNSLTLEIKKQKISLNDTSNRLSVDNILIPELEGEKGNTFNQYKVDFGNIAEKILEEKVRLENKIIEINEEIENIKNRLLEEKDINPEERKKLEEYLINLETLLLENNIAFHKAEQKTKLLIYKLRMIILAKDSINYQAKIEIEKEKTERKLTEEHSKRTILIFSIITSILLILAILFYFFLMRIKRQKQELEKVNKDLKIVKDELVKNVVEIRSQKRLIEDQNAQLDAFVYKASHDIKGPLRSIIGLTQTGIKSIKDPNSLEFFEHILKSTLKLDNLLADLLKVAKASQAEVVKTNVNISRLAKECLASFENLEEYKNMTFGINIPENLEFSTDEKVFYSIVQNFIENGIKYKDPTKTNPFLNISAEQQNQKLILKFSDNGLGLQDADQKKIFDMFYKVNPDSNGTGLGLHIVKLNVDKLKGSIEVSSIIGEGSTFTISLNN